MRFSSLDFKRSLCPSAGQTAPPPDALPCSTVEIDGPIRAASFPLNEAFYYLDAFLSGDSLGVFSNPRKEKHPGSRRLRSGEMMRREWARTKPSTTWMLFFPGIGKNAQ